MITIEKARARRGGPTVSYIQLPVLLPVSLPYLRARVTDGGDRSDRSQCRRKSRPFLAALPKQSLQQHAGRRTGGLAGCCEAADKFLSGATHQNDQDSGDPMLPIPTIAGDSPATMTACCSACKNELRLSCQRQRATPFQCAMSSNAV